MFFKISDRFMPVNEGFLREISWLTVGLYIYVPLIDIRIVVPCRHVSMCSSLSIHSICGPVVNEARFH